MASVPRTKTVLITGCSPGGIGHELAKKFHAKEPEKFMGWSSGWSPLRSLLGPLTGGKSKGVHVIATSRNTKDLAGLASMGMSIVALDVTNPETMQACRDTVNALSAGVLDILVNNAGRTYPMPLSDISLDETRATFETNVFGPMLMVQCFLRLLLASPDGLIINISSCSDRSPFPFKGVYAMTKAALSAYSRTLSVELHYFNVSVMNVVTGFVTTRLGRRSQDPVQPTLPSGSLFGSMSQYLIRKGGSRMSPDEYAEAVVTEALKSKGWQFGPLCLFGRKEWLWEGASSSKVWFMTLLGERFSKWIVMKMWGFWRLKQAIANKTE